MIHAIGQRPFRNPPAKAAIAFVILISFSVIASIKLSVTVMAAAIQPLSFSHTKAAKNKNIGNALTNACSQFTSLFI